MFNALPTPIVAAPMAGGPSTPALAAAVSNAGGLGMLAAGYLSASELAHAINHTAGLLQPSAEGAVPPFGVNLFVPESLTDTASPADIQAWQRYRDQLVARFPDVALDKQPRWSDDDWQAKLDLLTAADAAVRVPFVSFTFGLPGVAVIKQLHERGVTVGVTITNVADARAAIDAGVDVVIAQGNEAGGHQSTFATKDAASTTSVRVLLQQLADELPRDHSCAIIAAGGVAGPGDVAELLSRGASAVQVGTLFLTADEAGTKPVHKSALLSGQFTNTVVTRAFSGRFARALASRFTTEFSATAAPVYPQVHYLTSPIRNDSVQRNSPDALNLWAGTGFTNCQQLSAADLTRWLGSHVR